MRGAFRRRHGPKERPYTLRQAASVVFAVMTVLPMLVFAWTLYHMNALANDQVQLALGLALLVALLGFYLFRVLMGHVSELIQSAGKAVELGARVAATAGEIDADAAHDGALNGEEIVARRPSSPHIGQRAAWASAAATREWPDMSPSPQLTGSGEAEAWEPVELAASIAVAPAAAPGNARTTTTVPGLRRIEEVHGLNEAVAALWKREALRFEGKRVRVSVVNAPLPIVGTLVQAADDGMILDDGAKRQAIVYRRVSTIEPLETVGAR